VSVAPSLHLFGVIDEQTRQIEQPAIQAITEITCSDFMTRYQSARNPVIIAPFLAQAYCSSSIKKNEKKE
jgi:hypothetical protein